MIAYLFLLFVFFAYVIIDFLFLDIDRILSLCLNVGIAIGGLLCYFRLIYFLEKTLGNLSNISFKEKVSRYLHAMISTRDTLRITELPSVKQEQMKKIKGEFLDKNRVDSKEKVRAFIEALERKWEYKSERKFFIPFTINIYIIKIIEHLTMKK